MDRQPAAESCTACGYSLRGLPTAGRCPECGAAYDAAAPVAYVGRPMFGWLLLVVPALVMPAAVSLALHCAFAPCCLVEVGVWGLLFGGPIVGLFLAVVIAFRLAEWRHGLACRATPANPPAPAAYLLQTMILLTLLQIAIALAFFAAYAALSPALERSGLLPGK